MTQNTDLKPWVVLRIKPHAPKIQKQIDEALRELRKAAEDFIAQMATLEFPAAVVIDVDRDPRQ